MQFYTELDNLGSAEGDHAVVRILVSDDYIDIAQAVRMALHTLGHLVHEAPGGEHTLAMMESNAFDLLITDLENPHMNGLELIAQVSRRFPGLPVMVLSAGSPRDTVTTANSTDI